MEPIVDDNGKKNKHAGFSMLTSRSIAERTLVVLHYDTFETIESCVLALIFVYESPRPHTSSKSGRRKKVQSEWGLRHFNHFASMF